MTRVIEERRRFYVAGSSKEIGRASRFMRELEALGLKNSHDWTVDVANATAPDHEMSTLEARSVALVDLRAVVSSDLVVLLIPTTGSIGAWWEAGAASALQLVRERPYLISVGPDRRTIFVAAFPHFADDAEALLHVRARIAPPTAVRA